MLVNNAGIVDAGKRRACPFEETLKTNLPSNVSLDKVRAVLETNVFGVLAVYAGDAAAPARGAGGAHRQRVELRRLADEGLGPGLAASRDVRPCLQPASKTALNAMTLAFAIELESTGIKVNAACPGYTATDLNDHPRHAHGRAGRTRSRAARAARPGRSDGDVLERGRSRALVI